MSVKIFETPNTSFKVEHAIKLFNKCNSQFKSLLDGDGDTTVDKTKIFSSLVNYVQSYYYETAKGDYYFYDTVSTEFIYKTQKEFQNEITSKMDSKAFEALFRKNTKIHRVVSYLDKPRVYQDNGDYYINECKGLLHKTYKPYNEYSQDIQTKVQLVLSMIKEISCGNNVEMFQAYFKYLSQLIQGKKTEVIIYKKSEQGTGKSTETDFLMNYVLGLDVCVISGTEPLLKDYNKILLGKLLVIFEELPTFSDSQWSAVSSKLKTMATEKTMVYRGLFKDPIQCENISNFVINTNCESIKDSNGRRIIIMPVSNSRVGDYEYFANIRKQCFNLEVGEAFYSLMLEQDTTKFMAQRDFPEADLKRRAISNLLLSSYKFIKHEFVLKQKGIEKVKPAELHKQFQAYCLLNNIKSVVGKNEFISQLERVDIHTKKISVPYYIISYEELQAIADKKKWLCDLDTFEEDDECDDEPVSKLDYGLEPEPDYKKLYFELLRKMKN